ncbi:MAG TPA: hypothetical protein V6D08_13320 [Candidatus Obscuribacterales bacterium]
MGNDTEPIRIGELLARAGILSPEEIREHLEIAGTIGQRLGQTLVQLGKLTDHQLLSVVEVQALLADGAVSLDMAVGAIRLVCNDGVCLDDALKQLGASDACAESSRLGELLRAAGLVTQDDLWRALSMCLTDSIPLGHALLRLKILTPQALADALSAQKRIRAGQTSISEAARELGNH